MDWLLDTTTFISRSHCGTGWTTELIAINRVANFLIFLSYFTIPLSLLYLWTALLSIKKSSTLISHILFPKLITINFVGFILFCGLTHLCDVLVFEWPAYRLFTLLDCLAAAASVPTAIVLPYVLRSVIGLLREGDNSE